jgi:hypothetical protein
MGIKSASLEAGSGEMRLVKKKVAKTFYRADLPEADL